MPQNYRRVKLACYVTNISMAVVGNLPPLLFLTFRSLYGISYSLLGLLVLINFCTQLGIDLIFSFFSHKFNIPKAVSVTPLFTVAGLVVYALWPLLFPQSAYIGLVVGTVLFSVSGGFNEVLISPVIAEIPSEDPDREMSKLHSIYAWGVVAVVVISTLFLSLFSGARWHILALAFTAIPLCAAVLFRPQDIPPVETPKAVSGAARLLKNPALLACVLAIFLGGAAECTMAQWSSGFLEHALVIPKLWGDILGVALFAMMLGLGRSLYASFGRSIGAVIFACGIGTAVCYLTAAISFNPIVGLIACAMTGLCTSMLWPGNLIVASKRFPEGGVLVFALMAAGGDLGASVGPQLVGIITDICAKSPHITALAQSLAVQPDSLGMRVGMLFAALFPICAIPLYYFMWRGKKR